VAIGFGWWAAARTVDRIDRVVARLDNALSATAVRLARVESRVSTVRAELDEVRGSTEAIVAENPDLPRVRAEIERLLERLVPALDRLDATADSLRTTAAVVRGMADMVDQLNDDSDATVRFRNAANTIDRAAEALNLPRVKVDAVKSAKSVQLTQKLVTLIRDALAGSDMLVDGLTTVRQETAIARRRTAEYRDAVVVRFYTAAVVNTLVWSWGGLGQLCLIGWGRRRMSTGSR
jgi:hypothetical protein